VIFLDRDDILNLAVGMEFVFDQEKVDEGRGCEDLDDLPF
jgi:hypothetical protein